MGIELGSDRDGGLALTDLARREGPGPTRCRVVVGIAGIAFHQEVLDLLGRDPRLEVVGSVSHGDRLGAALAGRGADALVLCPTFAAALAALLPEDRPAVLMAAEEMTVPVLRLAIDVGAHGAFLWPEERGTGAGRARALVFALLAGVTGWALAQRQAERAGDVATSRAFQAYTEGLLVVIDDIAARLAPDDPPSARVTTLGVFGTMVGTLQLSRALADRALADDVLEQGIQNALALLAAVQ